MQAENGLFVCSYKTVQEYSMNPYYIPTGAAFGGGEQGLALAGSSCTRATTQIEKYY